MATVGTKIKTYNGFEYEVKNPTWFADTKSETIPDGKGGFASNPLILHDNDGNPLRDANGNLVLNEPLWLNLRKNGWGGSDIAALLGLSPWVPTAKVVNSKRGVKLAVPLKENKEALERGHIWEDFLARNILPRKLEEMGLKDFTIEFDGKMYKSPLYPMIADVDCFIRFADGSRCGGEIKTTASMHTVIEYWQQGKVPPYYLTQVRHYMAVVNIDTFYVFCAWGLNFDECACIRVDRNLDVEAELVETEVTMWNNHVVAGLPLDEEKGSTSSVLEYYGHLFNWEDVEEDESLDLSDSITLLKEREVAEQELNKAKAKVKECEEILSEYDARLMVEMSGVSLGTCMPDISHKYYVRCTPCYERTTTYDMERLQAEHPEIIVAAGSLVKKSLSKEAAKVAKEYEFPKAKTGACSIKVNFVEIDPKTGRTVKTGEPKRKPRA